MSAPTIIWYPWHFCFNILSEFFIYYTCFTFFYFFELKWPLIKTYLSQTIKHVSPSQFNCWYYCYDNTLFKYWSSVSIFLKLELRIKSIEISWPFYLTWNLLSSFNESMNPFVGYWKKNTSAECFFKACLTFLIFLLSFKYDRLKYFFVRFLYA